MTAPAAEPGPPVPTEVWLGRLDYRPIWQEMQRFTDARTSDTPDAFWTLEHEPVFTLGQAASVEHVLMPGDIPVIQTDRGGQVTYHGPGQLMVYTLIDIGRLGIGVRQLVSAIENAVIQCLANYGISGYARPDAPGIYVDDAKIASLGLRVRHGFSYHGLAVNVNMDLEPFSRINPCGFSGLSMTQLSALDGPTDLQQVRSDLIPCLTAELGLPLPTETGHPGGRHADALHRGR